MSHKGIDNVSRISANLETGLYGNLPIYLRKQCQNIIVQFIDFIKEKYKNKSFRYIRFEVTFEISAYRFLHDQNIK